MIYFLAIAPAIVVIGYLVYAALNWRREADALRRELAKTKCDLELKSAELERAKSELAEHTIFLERRMDARTNELREAQNEIKRLKQGK